MNKECLFGTKCNALPLYIETNAGAKRDFPIPKAQRQHARRSIGQSPSPGIFHSMALTKKPQPILHKRGSAVFGDVD